MASIYELNMHLQWKNKQCAGEDWFNGFMKRHPELSIKCAQPTSFARATSFNEANVKLFFENYEKVLDKHKFEPKDIYNVNETGVTTVQKKCKIVTKSGSHQVGALTSAKRGYLVTVAYAVNAKRKYIPPMFVFPRIRYQDHFVRDGQEGSIGAGNGSGWMQGDEFPIFLKHFQKYTSSSKDRKILLLLDNHSSHILIRALDYCSENGIVVLSFHLIAHTNCSI
ncbi:uncharacterized protein LOC136083360 [Hydra vulgaris]|uniref:Uncharacterized protein LOC136083360 n=1 Tax=Hydra vulgaris TaxID=6087 RepID=A0ABM4CAY1_HYDVU